MTYWNFWFWSLLQEEQPEAYTWLQKHTWLLGSLVLGATKH